MKGIYYYYWDTGNYTNGYVFGFLTKTEAKKHSKENKPNADINIDYLKRGEILPIYSGE